MCRLAARASAAFVHVCREDESAVQTLVRADLEAMVFYFVKRLKNSKSRSGGISAFASSS